MAYKAKYHLHGHSWKEYGHSWKEFELTSQGNVIIDSSIDMKILQGRVIVGNFVYLVYQRTNGQYRMIRIIDLFGGPYTPHLMEKARDLGEYLSNERVDNIKDVAKFLGI